MITNIFKKARNKKSNWFAWFGNRWRSQPPKKILFSDIYCPGVTTCRIIPFPMQMTPLRSVLNDRFSQNADATITITDNGDSELLTALTNKPPKHIITAFKICCLSAKLARRRSDRDLVNIKPTLAYHLIASLPFHERHSGEETAAGL